MGMELRAGRDRDSGPDRLARLIKAQDADPDEGPPEPDDDAVVDRWGATAMPDWLDTRQGRRTWNARGSQGFDCLDDRVDDESDDDASTADEDDEWEPPRRRWTMMPPAAIGLILIGLLGCGFAGYSLLRQNEPSTPLVAFDAPVGSSTAARSGARSSGTGTDTPAHASEKSAPAEVVVSVVGLVQRPGLVRLAADSRVADALARAGGARVNADTMSLNLAQIVHDGDQILVGQKGDDQVRSAVVTSGGSSPSPSGTSGTGGGAAGGSGGSGQLVNVNTATEAELDTLPGVGPVTAQSIIAWREANGSFASVDQLAEVDGIGEGRLAKLRPLVTVG
ncbi:helix-hairpin-helix domain-containing protein [Gordonia sp. HY442]|uniref:helix-hairpin-helix domain-containing protein n=1 Tax=Gordonia zhenghanii TaxID=2911516 RepID=UPI001F273127|nr:helix-hairpin-helix domain-containing protein [Gordonia zhenghanii]MCF8606477.1 helix-hairpin-helix domain-containing protein [Gordonia zhenghanii]